MSREGDVVHTWAVTTGHSGVVNGWFPAHPCSVDGLAVGDFFGDTEAKILHVGGSAWHIGSDLVEVVQTDQGTWYMQIVAPCETFNVVDVVEELVWEAQWIFNTDRIADAFNEAIFATFGAAAEFFVERFGLVDVFWGTDTVRECSNGSNRALFEQQVVVDELFR